MGAINASVSAYGYETRGVGTRCDVLIFDDVVDEKNSSVSAAARENLKKLVASTWLTRAEPRPIYTRTGEILSPGPMKVIIGTRYHEEDFYSEVLRSPSAYCSLVQAVSEDFTHIDVELIGAVSDPPHPVLTLYSNWQPVTA